MCKIICIANQKGGVGKTTTTLNLGKSLRLQGKKILLLDIDPQANLTSAIGLKNRTFESTVYEWIKGEKSFDNTLVIHDEMQLIPSDLSLSGADIELSTIPGRELLLREAIGKIAHLYDGILIDSPPSLGLLTLNALTAAHKILIPIQSEYLALEGVKILLETIEIVKSRLNHDLEIGGVVVTMYDSRQNLDREVLKTIRKHFKEKTFRTVIRKNVSLAEAPGFGRDIFQYRPESIGAKDYHELCQEVIQREVV